MLTYAIGDIHGMANMLEGALAAIAADADGRERRVVFLGDYTDRGPQSRRVLEILQAGPDDDREDWVLLAGNHCDMMMAAVLDRIEAYNWLDNGGHAVLAEYDLGFRDPSLLADARWLRKATRLFFHDEEQERFFVHAGIQPGLEIAEQNAFTMQWIREGFLHSEREHGFLVVHGHTVVRGGFPDLRKNRLNLDTGAVFGGAMSVGVFEDGTRAPDRYLIAPTTKEAHVEFETHAVRLPVNKEQRESFWQ